jgi:hypothetical protein
MKIFHFILLSLSLNEIAAAQTISFKAHFYYKNELLKNFTVLIDGNETTTNLSGLLIAPIIASKTQIKVEPKDKKFIILYPSAGNVFIPKDNSLVVEIILAGVTDDPNIKMYQRILKELNDAKNKPGTVSDLLKKKLEQIELQLKKLNYSSDDLRTARERQDGIDEFYPEITKSLKNYIVQANDLKNAFKYTADFAFTNPNALQKLVQAVTDYNPCIEKIMENHLRYAQKIKMYWQSDSLKNQYDLIADYILNDIHKQNILPLNDIKNNINKYFLGEMTGNKVEVKNNIQIQISQSIPFLTGKLNILETKTNDFIALLGDIII